MGKDFLILVAFTKEGVSRKLMQIQILYLSKGETLTRLPFRSYFYLA